MPFKVFCVNEDCSHLRHNYPTTECASARRACFFLLLCSDLRGRFGYCACGWVLFSFPLLGHLFQCILVHSRAPTVVSDSTKLSPSAIMFGASLSLQESLQSNGQIMSWSTLQGVNPRRVLASAWICMVHEKFQFLSSAVRLSLVPVVSYRFLLVLGASVERVVRGWPVIPSGVIREPGPSSAPTSLRCRLL